MRAAILGAYASDDADLLRELVRASTRLTHVDPAAEHGALAIAVAAAYAIKESAGGRIEAESYLQFVSAPLAGTEMLRLIQEVVRHVSAGTPLEEFLVGMGWGRGVSGYVNQTVPACLFCWLASPNNFRFAVEQVIIAGGDADSTGAIVGALAGISAGRRAIPQEWVASLIEWPRTVAWMQRLAATLAMDRQATVKSHRPVPLFWPGVLARNVLFLIVVILHGLRRLFPPY